MEDLSRYLNSIILGNDDRSLENSDSLESSKCRHKKDKRMSPGRTDYLIAVLSENSISEEDSVSIRPDLIINVYNVARESVFTKQSFYK